MDTPILLWYNINMRIIGFRGLGSVYLGVEHGYTHFDLVQHQHDINAIRHGPLFRKRRVPLYISV